jgi:hypothetical protein
MCRPGHVSIGSETLPSTPNSSDYQQNASELFELAFEGWFWGGPMPVDVFAEAIC